MRAARRLIPFVLFLVTLWTVTSAGALHVMRFLFSQGVRPPALSSWPMLWAGFWQFALPLLGILAAHELGHLWACRRAGVRASGPFFFPLPAVLTTAIHYPAGLLLGTFGACIRVHGRAATRAQGWLIGAAGPIAGFLVTLPCLWLGVSLSHAGKRAPAFLPDPWLLHWFSDSSHLVLHPIAVAARYGLILTGLNLLPIWPLDGWRVLQAAYGSSRQWFDASSLSYRHARIVALLVIGGICSPSF